MGSFGVNWEIGLTSPFDADALFGDVHPILADLAYQLAAPNLIFGSVDVLLLGRLIFRVPIFADFHEKPVKWSAAFFAPDNLGDVLSVRPFDVLVSTLQSLLDASTVVVHPTADKTWSLGGLKFELLHPQRNALRSSLWLPFRLMRLLTLSRWAASPNFGCQIACSIRSGRFTGTH